MNSIFKYALITCLTLLFIHPFALCAKECNDLIIVLDPNGEETTDSTSKAMGFNFLAALQEATAPIITTTNTVSNFCFWKNTYQTELDQIKQEAIKTGNKKMAETKAQKIFISLSDTDEAKSKTYPGEFFSVPLSLTDLTENAWDCYLHTQANLILLIPKNYSKKFNYDLTSCGFDSRNLTKVITLTPALLLQQLQTSAVKKNIDVVSGIESMLIKKLPDAIDQKSWNIYLTGHGNSAKKKKDIEQDLAKAVDDLNFWENSVIFWQAEKENKQAQAAQVSWSASLKNTISSWLGQNTQDNDEIEKHLQNAFTAIKNAQERKNKRATLLESLQNEPDNVTVPQTAFIAGLPLNDFSRLMAIFNNHIKTSFLLYSTCFGGGYNRTLVNESLTQLSANFIVVAQGINESTTVSLEPQFKKQGNEFILAKKRFTRFFNHLESFFGDPTTAATVSPQLKKDPLATIVKTVISRYDLEKNQPFVRIPSVGIFNALAVDKKIKILTNTTVKAHELEGKVISITDPGIEVVLMYPHYIAVPLHLRAHIAIVSPTQNQITQDNQVLHLFERVISDGNLASFIGNVICLNSSYSTIMFALKKLTCLNTENSRYMIDNKNPADVENVIVHIKSEKSSEDSLETHVTVLFNFNGLIYSYKSSFIDLAHNSNSFWDIAEELPVVAVDNDQLDGVIESIMNSSDLATLRSSKEPLSLSAIIQQRKKQINKTTVVQKPGALKKIMLSQQLRTIENALSPATINAQKMWLRQQHKPTALIITTLKRNNDNLTKLKQDIEKLMVPRDITEQEKTDFLNTINRLQAKIKKDSALLAATRRTAAE